MSARDDRPAELLEVLGRKYSTEILAAAAEPVPVRALEEEHDVPIATAYRRIEELVEVGLLEHGGHRLTEDRQRTTVYRRTVESLSVEFGDGELSLDLEECDDEGDDRPADGIDDLWKAVSVG